MCCCVAATGNYQCTGIQHALSTVYKKIIEYKKIFVELEAIFLFNIRRYKKIEYKKAVTPLVIIRIVGYMHMIQTFSLRGIVTPKEESLF